MKEFIETLLERLEEEKEGAKRRNAFDSEVSYSCAIKIVNQLAEEYINTSSDTSSGWVACSERLPDDFMSMNYLTTVKGRFYSEINYYCIANHKWYSNERSTKEVNVIAWQPLPASYKEGVTENE